jgi:O-acetyl-ADP-ribose deacetylase (regulator of RNase III)
MQLRVVQGDITEMAVDAIVNAANQSLVLGAGVAGAIRAKAGPSVQEECDAVRRDRYPHGVPVGGAVATTAGALPARWVIHAVGPVYDSEADPAGLLADCHRNSLAVADELGAGSVAFPAISTGVFGYPLDEAAPIAVAAVQEARTSVSEVVFVLFDEVAYATFRQAAGGD